MYAKYLLERSEDQILEKPHSFATFRYLPDQNAVYVIDIFVDKSHRKEHLATEIANEICMIAKEKGYTRALGTVCPTAKNSTESLRVLLAYGMKLKSASENCIIMEKEI